MFFGVVDPDIIPASKWADYGVLAVVCGGLISVLGYMIRVWIPQMMTQFQASLIGLSEKFEIMSRERDASHERNMNAINSVVREIAASVNKNTEVVLVLSTRVEHLETKLLNQPIGRVNV